MLNYEKSKNALIEYAKTNPKASIKELEKFIRFHASGLVLDYNNLRFDFFDYRLTTVVNLIMAMNIVKAYAEKHRPRNKNPQNPAYEIYLEKFKSQIQNGKLPSLMEEEFFEIYNAFNQISLNNLREINYDKDIFALFNLLKMNLENEKLVEFLTNLLVQKASFLNRLSNDFDEDFCAEFNKIFKKVARKNSISDLCMNLICLLEQGQNYDFALEDNYIFYEFTSHLDLNFYQGAILFEPTFLFLRRWISDEYLNDVELFVVLYDVEKSNFLNAYCEKYSNIHVVNFNDLKKVISQNDFNYQILFFGNHMNDVGIKQYLFKSISSFCDFEKLMIHDSDSNIGLYKSINDQYKLNEIQLFPQRKYDKKKISRSMFLEYDYDKMDDSFVTVIHFGLNKDGQYPSLSPKVFEDRLLQSMLDFSKIKIRSVYKNSFNASQKLSNQVRSAAQIFKFTDEISFYYRYSFDPVHNNFRVGAYIVDDNKKKVDATVKNCRLKTEEEIENWLLDVYPFEKVKKKDKAVSIWKEITGIYKTKYKNKSITFKTFLYLYHNDIISKFGQKQIDELKLLSDGVLGFTQLDHISSAIVNDELDVIYENEIMKRYALKALLSNIIDLAIDLKHAHKNQIHQEVMDERNYCDRMFYQSRDHLTIKYFSLKENQKIYKLLRSHVYENSLYLGAFIKLVTGLESNIVCGLQWKDFTLLEDYNDEHTMYQLVIRKQLLNDGSKFSDFKIREYYRKIPCSSELTNILLNTRNNLMDKLGLSDSMMINELPIVGGEDNRIRGGIGVVSPKHLTQFSNRIVKKMRKNYSLTANIPDSKKGTIETDFLNYGGDIFKSNFQHYGLYVAKFNEGELDYLQGRKSDMPFARNYCDYGNDASQLILQLKQNRFMRIFEEKESCYASKSTLTGGESYTSIQKKNYLSELILRVEPDDEVIINVDSNYGVDIDYTLIERSPNERFKK